MCGGIELLKKEKLSKDGTSMHLCAGTIGGGSTGKVSSSLMHPTFTDGSL